MRIPGCILNALYEAYDMETAPEASSDHPDNPTDITDTVLFTRNKNGQECTRDYSCNYLYEHDSPLWIPYRIGMSVTELPDGRIIMIGGEYDDYYDPNFFIYNDVIVYSPQQRKLQVFAYPSDVFPPTDFHSAVLIDDKIWIIGSLGYNYRKVKMHLDIQVLALDINTMKIERITRMTGCIPEWQWFGSHYMVPDAKCVKCNNDVNKIRVIQQDGQEFTFDTVSHNWECALCE